jgi:LytR cell envelope-related transcriptional attenuator
MNERRTDSSGLPLRAMVMVLLFLGVVFLLVGLQALRSGSDPDENEPVSNVTTTVTTTPAAAPAPPTPAAARADVRVYNLSSTQGAAETTADQLRGAGWNVTETGNLTMAGVTVNTVYFGEAPGERESADEVGQLLQAPVEPRAPDLTAQPPGVIVAVTG